LFSEKSFFLFSFFCFKKIIKEEKRKEEMEEKEEQPKEFYLRVENKYLHIHPENHRHTKQLVNSSENATVFVLTRKKLIYFNDNVQFVWLHMVSIDTCGFIVRDGKMMLRVDNDDEWSCTAILDNRCVRAEYLPTSKPLLK
jgi:hypothetical protein